MIGRARDLGGKPHGSTSLLLEFDFDLMADVYVSDWLHRKSVELKSCLTLGFPRPHIEQVIPRRKTTAFHN